MLERARYVLRAAQHLLFKSLGIDLDVVRQRDLPGSEQRIELADRHGARPGPALAAASARLHVGVRQERRGERIGRDVKRAFSVLIAERQ